VFFLLIRAANQDHFQPNANGQQGRFDLVLMRWQKIGMKIISWNVNGIRAVSKKGFLEWCEDQDADVICLQEIKAKPEQLEESLIHPLKLHSYWKPADRPGYSGVAIYSKKEPLRVHYGMGAEEFDEEGRVIVAEYPDFSLINAYFPNSQREGARLPYKLAFCEEILEYCNQLRSRGKNLILCGDYNIAHTEIDLANPKANKKNAGFLPEERAWMSQFLEQGYTDTFRLFEKQGGHYTWWTYRSDARERNIGWRIDYHCVNEEFNERIKSSLHHPSVYGSDHCPVEINLK